MSSYPSVGSGMFYLQKPFLWCLCWFVYSLLKGNVSRLYTCGNRHKSIIRKVNITKERFAEVYSVKREYKLK